MSRWYVLRCPDGYLGQQWQVDQNTITKPRLAVLPSLKAPLYATVALCHGAGECREQAGRALGVLGIECVPVPVGFDGTGKDAKIVELSTATDAGEPG